MESADWKVKLYSVQLVGIISRHAASQINVCMPMIVPRVTTCLRDTKKEVCLSVLSPSTALRPL